MLSNWINCESDFGYMFDNNEVIGNYLKDIRKIPLLSEEEERELLTIYHTTKNLNEKIKARNKLVESNLRFVISVARKFGTNENFYDLISEGNIGLFKAIEKFDLNSEYRFITYAVNWIIQHIQSYLIRKQKMVVPKNIEKLNRFVKKAVKELYKENERTPTHSEIAEYIKENYNYNVISLNDISFGNHMLSINEQFDDDNQDSETFESSRAYNSATMSNNVEEKMEKDSIREQAERFLSLLDARESEIVRRRLGIGCDEESFEAISLNSKLKIGKERIRQIYVSAINKMRDFA